MKPIRAREIAELAHKDQEGKMGGPYFAHVKRVVKNVMYITSDYYKDIGRYSDEEHENFAVVAWLHDVVEDQPHVATPEFWQELTAEQAEALQLLTHEKNQPYIEYIDNLKYNEIARIVKLADLEDNTDEERQALLDTETKDRLNKKYLRAKDTLNAVK